MNCRRNKARSNTRKEKITLEPIENMNYYFTPKKEENSIIESLEQMEKQVLAVITDVDDKITYLKNHPRKNYTPEPISYKKHLHPIINNSIQRNQGSPFKLSGKLIKKQSEKYNSRKNSMERLMQSTNTFNTTKQYKDCLMHKLLKQINKQKKPCIQGLFSEIMNKESIFAAYKDRHQDYLSKCPTLEYGKACETEKHPPLPVLTHSQEKSLVLNRYNLNKSISIALSKALSVMPSLHSIHLDENGLSDIAGAEILKGIIAHGGISSFYYTRNEISSAFLQEFHTLSKACVMTEMNFKGCKVSRQILSDFI